MNWVNAILAFSLAMIVFCTIVSALTEIVHELRARRQKGLQWMLSRLYSEMLKPYASQLSGKEVASDLESFLRQMTTNSSTQGEREVLLSALSFSDFVERLAGTAVGQALLDVVKAKASQKQVEVAREAEEVLIDLGRTFARYEADAKTYFAGWARWCTIILSVIVAFALNIDAVRLFSAFLADRDLTQSVLAQADAIAAASKQPGGGALGNELANLNEQVRQTTMMGLPIGTRYYPWCHTDDTESDPMCKPADHPMNYLLCARWVVSVLLAGVLIGLGGPFWFDVYSKLSKMMQSTRSGDGQPSAAEAPKAVASVAGAKYPYAPQLAPLFVAAGELAATVRAGVAQSGGK